VQILLTAFGPYEGYSENASWHALMEFAKHLPQGPVQVRTRLYPVDFDLVRERLREDLSADYDFALHLGQAPGSAQVRLEAIGLNIGGTTHQRADEYRPLVNDGAVAYRSRLPLAELARELREQGIPAAVSFHAGTYLCNATLYLTHYWCEKLGLKTQAAFVHLPLTPMQAILGRPELPFMTSTMAAQALHTVVKALARREPVPAAKLA
jgi:pyroglutamyl-peptidase